MENAPQGRIGRYVIQGELGRGAMGVVYRAQDPAIGRTVAVKTIRIGQFTDDREIKHVQDRMMREAQAAGILSHSNIVTIYDIQHEAGTAYIFMEFVDGDTLEKLLLSEVPLDKQVILRIIRQAAEALDYAHQRGIVHRDVKPANIMVSKDGTAKIADFGIARMQSHSLTQTGQILGTPNYMSPEQISGRPVDGKADQYSLAVMLFEVLTGEKPFVADSLPTLLFRVVSEAPQPAARLNPTLSLAIDDILQRALAKNPNDRFPTCTEFISAIEHACAATPGWTTQMRGASQSLPTVAAPVGHQHAEPKQIVFPSSQETVAAPIAPEPAAAAPAAPKPVPVPEAAAKPAAVPEPAPAAAIPAPAAEPEAKPEPSAFAEPVSRRPVTRDDASHDEPEPKKLNMKAVIAVGAAVALIGVIFIVLKLTSGGGGDLNVKVQPPPEAAVAQPDQQTAPAASQPVPAATAAAEPPKPAPATKEPRAAAVAAKPAEAKSGGGIAAAIRTNPEGARIIIDDGKVPPCTSPCQVELAQGRHTATIQLDTYKTEMRIFNIPQDANMSVNMVKLKGFLEVVTTPAGATITIDGAENPQKSPALIPLVVGRHTVVVTLPGKPPYTQTFEMRGEATVSLHPNWAN